MRRDLITLINLHRQLTENHLCNVYDEDYYAFEPQKNLLLTLCQVENSNLTVYDFNKRRFLLKSTKFKEKLGYSKLSDVDENEIELFHSLIHPDDFLFVLDTEIKAFDFINKLSVSEKKDYKLIYDFRVKNASGIYLRFIHQMVTLELDRDGKTWLTLIVTDLVSDIATEETPQRKMMNMKTGKTFLFKEDNQKNQVKILSSREKEILSLISQGLDSRQISDRLFISVNTVNNHRQKIISKTKTLNTMQALLYAKRIGII